MRTGATSFSMKIQSVSLGAIETGPLVCATGNIGNALSSGMVCLKKPFHYNFFFTLRVYPGLNGADH